MLEFNKINQIVEEAAHTDRSTPHLNKDEMLRMKKHHMGRFRNVGKDIQSNRDNFAQELRDMRKVAHSQRDPELRQKQNEAIRANAESGWGHPDADFRKQATESAPGAHKESAIFNATGDHPRVDKAYQRTYNKDFRDVSRGDVAKKMGLNAAILGATAYGLNSAFSESEEADKVDSLISEAIDRIELQDLKEDVGNTNADGSTDRNPGLTDTVRERIEAAGKKAQEAGEVDDGPSHIAGILNKLGDTVKDTID